MKKTILSIALVAITFSTTAQVTFTDATSMLNNPDVKSGVAMAIVDMDNDGLDDIVRLDDANFLEIEFQKSDGTLERMPITSVGGPWGMAIADVDKNGYNDIIVGGAYDDLKLLKANSDGTAYTVTTLGGPDIFLQNANFADIDNDGTIDFFGCHDDGISSPYKNDGAGNLTYDLGLINAESTVASDNSGNYGSIWTDYDNDGDLDLYISKCRQGVNDPMDGRRLNLLFENDGNNNYTDVAEGSGLRPMLQTWSSNFEDIDNDGDFDVVMINHPDENQIYENNGDGTFSEITASTGIEADLLDLGFGIQVAMEDFDNDGFIDILMTTLNGNHKVFMNNGDLTFSTMPASGMNTNGNTVQSAALGDVNNDGFIDIIAGYAEGFNGPSNNISDQLFLNDGNSNNWSKIILEGTDSNPNGIGARVEAVGAWGTQTREVRAGESYGTQNSLANHFGLGTATTIDEVNIYWPSGLTETYTNLDINETYTFVEGQLLGANENTATSFVLFPNPANDQLSIKLSNATFNNTTMDVIDVAGKVLMSTQLDASITNNVNISQLSGGIYFARIGGETIKFVKL